MDLKMGFYQKEREIDEWENCSSLMGLFYGYERVLFWSKYSLDRKVVGG